MREETVVYKVFKFDELDPKVQEKVLDDNRHWNVEHFEWWDSSYEMFQEDLAEKGFLDVKIYFSGFCCQGDGASFTAKSFDTNKLINALEGSSNFKKFKKYIPKLVDAGAIKVGIRSLDSRYSHENTQKLEIETDTYSKKTPKLHALVEAFEEELESLRYDLSRKIYKSLNEEYDYLTSDEAIKESIDCNDVEFHESGKIYY